MSAPEGWYPDPAGNPGLERYWDGSSWSSETRPIGDPEPPPAPEPVAVEQPDPFGGDAELDRSPAGDGVPPVPTMEPDLPPAPGFDQVAERLPPAPGLDQVMDDGLPPAPSFDQVAEGLPPAPSFDQVADGLPPAPDLGGVADGLPSAPDLDGVVDGLPSAPSFDEVSDRLPSAPDLGGVVDGLPPAPGLDQPGLPPAPGLDQPGLPPAPGLDQPGDGLPPAPGFDQPGMEPAGDPGLPLAAAGAAAAVAPPPPGAMDSAPPAAAPAAMPGFGGIRTELLSDARYAEVASNERVVRQNSRLIKVVLGDDILARQGAMVAFQGQIDFDYEGSGAGKFLKKAVTGEGLPLMRCSGQGELFLADSAYQIHIIYLDGAGLTVNGKNVLAFEPSLSWDIERIKGAGMMAGGLFNTRLEGHGWVAITTDGDPVVLKTDQPTFADTDAAVAWSSSLSTSLNKTVRAGALIGRGSGEAVQLAFQGQGIVIVQPSEGSTVPPHSH